MTTVINLNFLNFFSMKLDNHSLNLNVNDARSYNQYFDNRRQDYSKEQEEVIDITPYSRVVDDNDNSTELQLIDTKKPLELVSSFSPLKTYNSKGKTIPYFQEKGVHVNAYA